MHQGDTGFTVSVANGSLNRRSSAVAGEKRGMQIDARFLWRFNHSARKNLSVSYHDGNVAVETAEFFDRAFVFAKGIGLKNGNPGFLGHHFNSGRCQNLLPTNLFIGLRVDADQLMVGQVQHPAKGRKADFSGTHENESHIG